MGAFVFLNLQNVGAKEDILRQLSGTNQVQFEITGNLGVDDFTGRGCDLTGGFGCEFGFLDLTVVHQAHTPVV